jgi:hypothetical protein
MGLATALVVAGSGIDVRAQESADAAAAQSASIASLIRWTASLPEAAGRTAEVRFAIYQDQAGGMALWSETQTVKVGADGRYSVLLGAASAEGLPRALFQGGVARWIEARPLSGTGSAASPRSLLAAVPYAFKAIDAETLAGRAASDYITREDLQSAAGLQAAQVHPDTNNPVTGAGTNNYVPVWTGAATLGNSPIVISGVNVGFGTTAPVYPLDVSGTMALRGGLKFETNSLATPTAGVQSSTIEFVTSSYSSATHAAVPQYFIWQADSTGNNTANPAASLFLLASSGSASPKSTGFSFGPTGLVTFAPGQTFPGTGTITGVSASSPLTGSATSGPVTLGLDTSALETTLNGVYASLGANNNFAGAATFNGPITASSTASLGSAITGGSMTGTGVIGNSQSPGEGAAGILGYINTSPSASYTQIAQIGTGGVWGDANGNPGGSDWGAGIIGTASTVTGYGGVFLNSSTIKPTILAQNNSNGIGISAVSSGGTGVGGTTTTGDGVAGNAIGPSAGSAGVLGYTANAQSSSYAFEVGKGGVAGVWGDTTGNPSSNKYSAGVIGTSTASDGYGGVFVNNSAAGYALFGKNLNSGNGVYGESAGSGTAGTGGTAVYGFSSTPAGGQAGILGKVYQTSNTFGTVRAVGPVGFVAGVWGDAGEVNDGTQTYEAGVVGTGDDITAGVFENNSSQHPTLSVTNQSSGGSGLFRTLMAATPEGACGIGGKGDLTCTGQVKTLATTGGGARKVETYAMQSPENWMEDFGSGLLERGVAVVKIDPSFAETVSETADYHVFITPNGDSKGLYVIRKTSTSFEVRESGGGTSSLAFDYRIVAKRRGYEGERLTDVTERFNRESAARVSRDAGEMTRQSRQEPGAPGADGDSGARGLETGPGSAGRP